MALIPGAPTGDVSASASTDPDAPLDAMKARDSSFRIPLTPLRAKLNTFTVRGRSGTFERRVREMRVEQLAEHEHR